MKNKEEKKMQQTRHSKAISNPTPKVEVNFTPFYTKSCAKLKISPTHYTMSYTK